MTHSWRGRAEAGIDIFRVFDALNDPANVRRAAQAVKRAGKHLQLAICYSVTEEGRLGGRFYNLDYYLSKAKQFADLGADSICIKDMGGLLAPYDAYELVSALKKTVDIPLQLHSHYTSGMATMSALKADRSRHRRHRHLLRAPRSEDGANPRLSL